MERELVLVHFGRVMTTDEPLAELDCRGLLPAKFEELFRPRRRASGLQREFPIVAFGTSFVDGNGARCFACLDGCDGERTLDLDYGVLIPPAHGGPGTSGSWPSASRGLRTLGPVSNLMLTKQRK